MSEYHDVDPEESAAADADLEPLDRDPRVPLREIERDKEAYTLPRGFLRQSDSFLTSPRGVLDRIVLGNDLHALSRAAFFVTVAMSAFYGIVMGGTNFFQGSAHAFSTEFVIMVATAVKVPCLFLITLAIVVPPVYVSSTFAGARVRFDQMVALLLVSIAVTATVLASMGSVALFFSITTRSYAFIKVLHVAFFAYAGVAGLSYLIRGYGMIINENEARPNPLLFPAWLLLYMFVGTQLAWVMRPFVGNPGMEFQLFRPFTGNFYENVWASIVEVVQSW